MMAIVPLFANSSFKILSATNEERCWRPTLIDEIAPLHIFLKLLQNRTLEFEK